MKIAIHKREGSFSDRWILYCQEHNVPYKLVNCYDSSIIQQLSDCDGLMWHWSHEDYRAQNFARQLIYALEKKGLQVYPNFNSCFHFDDKVGQKYLFEAIDAPLVKTFTFYDKKNALEWINKTSFPKVFKLRGGAGSANVKLIKNKYSAKRVVNKAFGNGFPLIGSASDFKQRIWIFKRDRSIKSVIHLLKGIIRVFYHKENIALLPIQKGYVYFQEFIPNNIFDDRIVIIGNRALAIRRFNRKNDFRASGSGIIKHDNNLFNVNTIKIAFSAAEKINSQSLAFDFVYNNEGKPHLVEMSYGFAQGSAYDSCLGYWDSKLIWHDDNVDPQRYIIEDFLNLLL
ncbi:MAG: ATP-grasp domain-containing protein [Candidatus Saccharimonadaceae bacterium]